MSMSVNFRARQTSRKNKELAHRSFQEAKRIWEDHSYQKNSNYWLPIAAHPKNYIQIQIQNILTHPRQATKARSLYWRRFLRHDWLVNTIGGGTGGRGQKAPPLFWLSCSKVRKWANTHAIECLTWWKIVHQIASFKPYIFKKSNFWGAHPLSDTPCIAEAQQSALTRHFLL